MKNKKSGAKINEPVTRIISDHDTAKEAVKETVKEDSQGYVVDGFLFADRQDAARAAKELQGILYLQRNNNLKDIRVMKQVYQKLLSQGLFRTPVGLNYLKYLQNAIAAKEGFEEVSPIPVQMYENRSADGGKGTQDSNRTLHLREMDDIGFRYRRRFRIAMAVVAVLSACLVCMLVIASTTNQPNILNYEEKLVDKYEQWEQELEERESLLKDLE